MGSEPEVAPHARLSRVARMFGCVGRASAALSLVVVLSLLGLVSFALGSPAVARWLVDRAMVATEGRLSVEGLSGSLWSGLAAGRLAYSDEGLDVRASGVLLRPEWRGLLAAKLTLSEIRAERVEIEMLPEGSERGVDPKPALTSIAIPLPLPLRVNSMGIERVEFSAGDVRRDFEAIRLTGELDASRYWIERAVLVSRGVRLSVRDLLLAADRAPFRLTGQVLAEGDAAALSANLGVRLIGLDPTEAVHVGASLSGALDDLTIVVSGKAWGAEIEARAGLRPLDSPFTVELSGVLRQLATRRVLPTGPAALLDARFELAWPQQRFSVDIENRQPARLEDLGLPIRTLSLSGALASNRISLERIAASLARPRDAQVGQGPGPAFVDAGRIEGQLALSMKEEWIVLGNRWPDLSGRLALKDIDLRTTGARLPATRISGTVGLDAGRLTAALEDPGLVQAPLRLALQSIAGRDAIQIEQAQAEVAGAKLTAQGRIGGGPATDISLSGRLDALDPAAIGALMGSGTRLPEGLLSGSWRLSGALAGLAGSPAGPAGAVRNPAGVTEARTGIHFGFELAPGSRLAARAISGSAEGQWWRGRLRALDLGLSQANDRLAVRGSLGAPDDRLEIDLRAADLGRFMTNVRGPARLTGHLGGRLDDPALELSLRAGPLDLGAREKPGVQGLAIAASVTGTIESHRVDIDLNATPERLRLGGTAGWQTHSGAWEARVDRLSVEGRLRATLVEPFDLDVSPSALSVRGLAVSAADGRIRLDGLEWRDGVLRSAGTLSRLSLAPLADWLDSAQHAAAKPDGISPGGQSSAPRAQSGTSPGDRTTGEAVARLRSLRADAQWALRGSAWQRLSGSIALEVKADPAAVTFEGRDSGWAESRLGITLDEGRLSGSARLTVPSLAFSRRLTAPDWVAEGALSFDGQMAGTIERPELEGLLKGESLSLANRSLGWRLRDGSLSARWVGRRMEIDSLRFASGERGAIELNGRISPLERHSSLDQGSPLDSGGGATRTSFAPFDAELGLRLERFVVPLDPGQRLLLSGETRFVARDGTVSWTGAVTADEGLIEFGSVGAPDMPSDLVIVDRRRPVVESTGPPDPLPAGPEPQAGGWTPVVQTEVRIALGERLRVQGGGLEARLTGELMLSGQLPRDPRVYGRVQLRDGSFAAYGRKLALTRGEVRFNGEVDNPALDIVAMRNSVPVSAGVAVTGQARSPRVRLVSDPDLPDAQKLSWLVLGTGLEDAAAAGQALALREAALTLLGDDDGGMVGGLSQALGVDAIGFGRSGANPVNTLERSRLGPPGLSASAGTVPAGGSVREEVVSVSKRLNSRLTVSYERGIQGIWNLVRLQYEISNRLSLRAQSGSENAVDLLYFWWFD